MKYDLQQILDTFSQDVRLLENYLVEIRKSIAKLAKELADLKEYLEAGGSIEIKPRSKIMEDGRVVLTSGMEDNPKGRTVIAFALNNKIEETKKYINVSMTMAFTYLITVFDAKYDDIMRLYYESIADTLSSDTTAEKRALNFGYKSFKQQMQSLKTNAQIDFEKILGEERIDKIIEIRETRNVIVHNAGIINSKYLTNIVPPSAFQKGDIRVISESYLDEAKGLLGHFLYELSNEIDQKIEQPI